MSNEKIEITSEDLEKTVGTIITPIKNEVDEMKKTIDTKLQSIEDTVNKIKVADDTSKVDNIVIPKEIKNYKDSMDLLNWIRGKFNLNKYDGLEGDKLYKDVATMTTTNQAALVSPEYALGVDGQIGTYGLARQVGTTRSLISNALHLARVTGSCTAYILGEGSSVTQSDIMPKDVTVNAVAAQIKLAISKESLAFAQPNDIMDMINQDVAYAIGVKEDICAMSGSSTLIDGVYMDADCLQFTASVSGAFQPTYQDLLDFQNTIDPSVRGRCRYFVGSDHLAKIQGIVHLSGSLFAYNPVTDRINGYPYTEFSSGDVLNSATTNTPLLPQIVFGDPTQMWFADNGTLEVTADNFTGAATRTLYFYFTKLFAFGLRNPSKFVVWYNK